MPDGRPPHQRALADAGVEDRRLPARIGADQQERVRLFDAGDRGVEQIGRRGRRAGRRPGGSRCCASRAPHQVLQRHHRTRQSARSPAMAAMRSPPRSRRARRWRRTPRPRSPAAACRRAGRRGDRGVAGAGRRRRSGVLSEIHSSLTSSLSRGSTRMTSGPRTSMRMLLPTASITSMDSVLRQLPGRATKAYGFEVSAPTGQRSMMLPDSSGDSALLDIGADLHVLAAAGGAQLRHAGDLGGEADAAGAVDAAGHVGLDQRAEVLVLNRPLVLVIAAAVEPVGPSPGPGGRTRRPDRRSGSRADG